MLAEKADLVSPGAELRAEMAELRTDIRAVEARLTRWMFAFFVPLWLGVLGPFVTLLMKL